MNNSPWRFLLTPDDMDTITEYSVQPRCVLLSQYASLFMMRSWQIVQNTLNKIEYQSKRGY
ncbi:hypothetical protein LGIDLPPJ_00046 [Klebsiella phage KP13-27]|nr:hypothetical protein LGIDLPPJ_00046 [Klebsiella phage KP13-27]